MRRCGECRDPQTHKPLHGYYGWRDRLRRRAGGCNWLDWMVTDGKCPHCGGPTTEITTVTPLGRMMDGFVPRDEEKQ